MSLSLFEPLCASTCSPHLAITIRLRIQRPAEPSHRLRSRLRKLARGRLGQGGEFVEGAVPLDLLMEIIAGGCGANPQMFYLGDICKVNQNF